MCHPDDFAEGLHLGKVVAQSDRGEFISYSEWETEADIERYKNSAAHKSDRQPYARREGRQHGGQVV